MTQAEREMGAASGGTHRLGSAETSRSGWARTEYEDSHTLQTFYEHVKQFRHLDLVGGNVEDRAHAISAAVLPEITKRKKQSVFVADFSGVRLASTLTNDAAERGHGVYVWEVSANHNALFDQLTPEQMIEAIAPRTVENGEQKIPDKTKNLFRVLIDKLSTTEQEGKVTKPSVNKILQGVNALLGEKNDLDDDQWITVRKSFPARVLKDEPFLSSIQDHLLDLQKGDQEALTKSVLNQGSEKSVAIVNCSITNTTTDRNKRETILRKMLHSFIVNENWGKEKEANILDHVWARPDVFVIAGAENVDPDFLQEMIKFCEASKVKTIVSYDKVNDKNKHLLGQRGPVGVMAMSNWDDAELVSGVLGHTTVKKVTDEGDSVNVSVGSGEGESSNHPYNEHGGFRKAELSLGRSMNFPSDSTSFDQRKGYGNVDERKLSPQRIQRLSGERIYFVTRSETSPYGPLAFTLEQVEAAKAERERGFPAYDRDETGRYPSTAAMQQLAQEGRTEEVAFEESRRLPLSVQHRRIRRRIKARATQAQKEVEGEFSKDVLARRDRRNP